MQNKVDGLTVERQARASPGNPSTSSRVIAE
jgi:hypothetical protein